MQKSHGFQSVAPALRNFTATFPTLPCHKQHEERQQHDRQYFPGRFNSAAAF